MRGIAIGATVAVAVAAAGAVAFFARRRRPGDAPRVAERREWRCRCGQAYRVSGTDRHRVYWPADADESEPVMDGRCVSCEAPLPAEHERVAA